MAHLGPCCNQGSVTASSRPIQAHAATFALIPHYNVPDPPTNEEDATMPLTIRANRPMNMDIYEIEIIEHKTC